MNAKWTQLKTKFEALQLRERALLVGALIALVYLVWDFLLLQPLAEANKIAEAKERIASQNIVASEAELSVMQSLSGRDPHAQLKQELQQLQEKKAQLDADLESLSAGLVRAEKLPQILHQVLASTGKMQLLSMSTMPVQTIDLQDKNQADATAETTQAQLYKHGLQVKLQGSYRQTYEFLQALEVNAKQFYWEAFAFEVQEYPQALVTLRLFTLAGGKGTFDGGLNE